MPGLFPENKNKFALSVPGVPMPSVKPERQSLRFALGLFEPRELEVFSAT